MSHNVSCSQFKKGASVEEAVNIRSVEIKLYVSGFVIKCLATFEWMFLSTSFNPNGNLLDHLQTVVKEHPSQSSRELDKPLNLSHTSIIMHPHDFGNKCLNLVSEFLIIYQHLSFLEDLTFVLHWRFYLLTWIVSSSVMEACFSVIIADENKKRLSTYKIRRIVPQTRTTNWSKI